MPTGDTLLAHLVPKLTPQVEDAATDALAYILNKSKPCLSALVDLVTGNEFLLDPVDSVRTQVVREDKSRLDLVGYDSDGSERLIIESKFWAALLDGQASGYVRHLDCDKPSLLLFVAPEVRRAALWNEICAQMDASNHPSLVPFRDDERLLMSRVGETGKYLALTSWICVLEQLKGAASELALVSEIEQLVGLVTSQGDRRFKPLHAEDLDASIPRRILDFNRIVDNVVRQGVDQKWLSTKGLAAAAVADGYGRFIKFLGDFGERQTFELSIRISYSKWARSGETPIWLRLGNPAPVDLASLNQQLGLSEEWRPGEWLWVPILLKAAAFLEDVVEDAARQVRAVRDRAIEIGANRA
ncbi:hypothetical protein [Candidatus Poriferisodalis sp.]